MRPASLLRGGYVGSITYEGNNVKLSGVKFSDITQETEKSYLSTDDAEAENREEALEAKGIVRVLPNKKDRQQIKAEKEQRKKERRQRILDAKAEADRRMKRRGKAKPEEAKKEWRTLVP